MQSHMPTNWQKIEEKVSVAPTYPLSVTITYAISDNLLFHMVASVLLSMVAFLRFSYWRKSIQRQVRTFEISSYQIYYEI